MIGLDTNVLIRFIVQDDPTQSKIANARIEKACRDEHLLYINHIVLCETWWVLSRAYKLQKTDIIDVMEKILYTKHFAFEDKAVALRALKDFKDRKADFADVLIGMKNELAGCKTTLSFDQATKSLPNFTLL